MPEPDQTLKAKLVRRLRWLNWLRLRPESQAVLVLLIITGCVIWYRNILPVALQVGIWASLLVAFASVLRRGWITFFGPVFTYDVVRSARRSNFAVLRSFYAAALLVVLFLVYSSIARTQGN